MWFDIFLKNYENGSTNIRITQKNRRIFFESLKNKFIKNELLDKFEIVIKRFKIKLFLIGIKLSEFN
jgi:hypothetical protein